MYEYSCRLIRVVNGNTIEAVIDLGFGISITQRIRLFGINDTEQVKKILFDEVPREFICQTIYNKKGKVGRVLGTLFKIDDQGNKININELLINKGIAEKFNS